MDDLLTLHADRVTTANAAHSKALASARDRADEALRAQIADFGAKLLEASAAINAACQGLLAALDRVASDATTEAAAAFAENLAEIAASGAAMQAEMRERAAFLMTGKLPLSDPLPSVETRELAAPVAEAAE